MKGGGDFNPGPAQESPWTFLLAAADGHLHTSGVRSRLESGRPDTLGQRVNAFFREQKSAQKDTGPQLLVGAMPFDRMADDLLFQPETVSDIPSASPAVSTVASTVTGRHWQVRPEPSRAAYEAAVSRALDIIAASRSSAQPLSKIVLSRSLVLETESPIDVMMLSARLGGDPGAVRFVTPTGAAEDGTPGYLVGATPELLLSKKGPDILSRPLAGSAPRSADPDEDRAAATMLMQSRKDRREHQWVVEAILDVLAPFCTNLSAPKAPALVSTQTMWHLGTEIRGWLKDPEPTSSAELAAALHPTPAVGGTPRESAMALIPELEGYDRGFYAGAVGWTDGEGDGDWYVSLRCAEVSGRRARVYAGAGIVEGSHPAQEADETSAKLQAILRALGVDESGRSLSSRQLPAGAAA